MPLISFSGETSEGPFWKQICEGKKMQTCRKPRKYPIRKGDTLYLYWKCRIPEEKKPIHFIGVAHAISVKRMKYGDFAFDEDFAHRDGFKDSAELRKWFGDAYGMKYDVIHFKLDAFSQLNDRPYLYSSYQHGDMRL